MKIIIAGNYGAENLGDEMILEGLLESIRTISPNAEITVLSGNPTQTSQIHNVKSLEKFPAGIKSFLKYLFNKENKKSLKECDLFILGGGGLFEDLSFRAHIIWALQALKAHHYKKPILMYGQSIGKIKNKLSKFLIKKLFNNSALITVRDNDSKKNLQDLGVKRDIYVIPDLAFRKLNNFEKEDSDEIIVALRQIKGLSEEFKKTISEFLDYLIENKNIKIKFIDFQKGKSYSDKKLHLEIIEKMKNKTKIEHLEINNTQDLLKIFSKAKAVLGMRLHSIISSIKAKTPFIALNYARKIEALLKDTNLDELMVDIKETSINKLKLLFEKIEREGKNIEEKLGQINKKYFEKHKEIENSTLQEILKKFN